MNEILLIDPSRDLALKYRGNAAIAYYSDKSISFSSANANQRDTRLINYPVRIDEIANVDLIKSKLQWTAPIWYRWIGKSEDYDLYFRTCLLFVVALAQAFDDLKIRYAVFSTGAAHHVEYSLIEIACQIAKVKQIYLYATPFGSGARLLPLIQEQGVSDRKLLPLNISTNRLRDNVIAYLENYLAGQVPKSNEKIDRKAVSYSHAIFQIFLGKLKALVKKLIRKNRMALSHPIDQYSDYGPWSLMRMVRRQKQSLKYYADNAKNSNFVDLILEREGRVPIVLAHYQPEATSFPEGGDFHNHIDLIVDIRKKGYEGTIFYKEHPGSWIYFSKVTGVSRVGLCRSVDYYKQLESLGCVFLEVSFRIQQNNSDRLLPVTITGSIAIERSLAGFATCCAGHPWFKSAPGIFGISDVFGDAGIFYDNSKWLHDGKSGINWFDENLSNRTMTNAAGIGTGMPSSSSDEMSEYMSEFERLIDGLMSLND